MANAVSLTGRYLLDGLEIFLRPVTVLRRSGERGAAPAAIAASALLVVAIVTELFAFANSRFPFGFDSGVGINWQSLAEGVLILMLAAVVSAVILFVVGRLLRTNTTAGRALSVNTTLTAAVCGGLLIAMLVKGAIMIASPFDPVLLQSVIAFGPQATLMLGALIAVYSIIAARFGALVSWPIAVMVAVIQLVIIVAMSAALDQILLTNELAGVADTIENLRAGQGEE